MLALALSMALAHDPGLELDPQDPSAHGVWLWQGFEHDWERAAAGFAVPHRVSRFESRLVEPVHTEEGASASFVVSQSTGVDGDWMTARGYATYLRSPDVYVERGVLRFSTVDLVLPGEAPKALARFEEVLVLELPPGVDDATLLLQGLQFASRCEDDEGACNSDGIWPYRFSVVLGSCTLRDDLAICPVTVEVGRAWTPGHGGVRGIEVKPLNQRMGIDVEVSWAALLAPRASLLAHSILFENALASTKDLVVEPQPLPLPPLPTGYGRAAVGLHALAFEFFPTSRRRPRQQRGRYLGGWATRVGVGEYDGDTGRLVLTHAGGIFLPKTVAGTGVSVEVGMTALQLSHPQAQVMGNIEVSADLCSNSHGAPWFSDWQRCGEVAEGERVEARQPVTWPTSASGADEP